MDIFLDPTWGVDTTLVLDYDPSMSCEILDFAFFLHVNPLKFIEKSYKMDFMWAHNIVWGQDPSISGGNDF